MPDPAEDPVATALVAAPEVLPMRRPAPTLRELIRQAVLLCLDAADELAIRVRRGRFQGPFRDA